MPFNRESPGLTLIQQASDRFRRTEMNFTPTQAKMMAVLADGQAHTVWELHACLPDDLGPKSNIWAHLFGIRKRLRPKGEDIVCERVDSKTYYRLVRLTASPYAG